jgi:hypothetical protein
VFRRMQEEDSQAPQDQDRSQHVQNATEGVKRTSLEQEDDEEAKEERFVVVLDVDVGRRQEEAGVYVAHVSEDVKEDGPTHRCSRCECDILDAHMWIHSTRCNGHGWRRLVRSATVPVTNHTSSAIRRHTESSRSHSWSEWAQSVPMALLALVEEKSAPNPTAMCEPSIKCPLCLYDRPNSECTILRGCGHSLCIECLRDYLLANYKEAHQYPIRCCCDHACREQLDYRDVSLVLTEEQMIVYDKFSIRSAFDSNKSAIPIYCPLAGCSFLMLLEQEALRNPQLTCLQCHRSFCAKCSVVWHAGLTCEAYMQTRADHETCRANEALLEDLLKAKNWFRCPECGQVIERSSGCNHITHFANQGCTTKDGATHFCALCSALLDSQHNTNEKGSDVCHFPEGYFGPCRIAKANPDALSPQARVLLQEALQEHADVGLGGVNLNLHAQRAEMRRYERQRRFNRACPCLRPCCGTCCINWTCQKIAAFTAAFVCWLVCEWAIVGDWALTTWWYTQGCPGKSGYAPHAPSVGVLSMLAISGIGVLHHTICLLALVCALLSAVCRRRGVLDFVLDAAPSQALGSMCIMLVTHYFPQFVLGVLLGRQLGFSRYLLYSVAWKGLITNGALFMCCLLISHSRSDD